MKHIVADIETIPNINCEKLAKTVEIKVPSNYKDTAKIEAYIAEERANILPKLVKEASLNPLYGRMCCICADINGEKFEFYDKDEKAMLQSFADMLYGEDIRLITYFGKSFDLPFIERRMALNGVVSPFLQGHRSKYDSHNHIDLHQLLTNFGGFGGTYMPMGLKPVSDFLGFKSDIEVNGADVYMMYEMGQIDSIVKYCHEDVARTLFVAEKFNLLGV